MALTKDSAKYVTVGFFRNETDRDLHLILEMMGYEVVMSPGHFIELLASRGEDLLPITTNIVPRGLQIHPHKELDPDWHVRFAGKLICVEDRTVLAEHE